MKTIFILDFFILVCVSAYAQTEPLNQIDQNGRKNGVWIEYLDSTQWNILRDSTNASYIRYTYFNHGDNLYPENTVFRKRVTHKDSTLQNFNSRLLNGTYDWYDKKGRLLSVEYYSNGEIQWYKSYTWGIFTRRYTGKVLHEFCDFRIKYKDQKHTAYYEHYDMKGNKKTYYFRQGSQGWAYYEE